jgi:hypothetical protein
MLILVKRVQSQHLTHGELEVKDVDVGYDSISAVGLWEWNEPLGGQNDEGCQKGYPLTLVASSNESGPGPMSSPFLSRSWSGSDPKPSCLELGASTLRGQCCGPDSTTQLQVAVTCER